MYSLILFFPSSISSNSSLICIFHIIIDIVIKRYTHTYVPWAWLLPVWVLRKHLQQCCLYELSPARIHQFLSKKRGGGKIREGKKSEGKRWKERKKKEGRREEEETRRGEEKRGIKELIRQEEKRRQTERCWREKSSTHIDDHIRKINSISFRNLSIVDNQ